MIKTIEETDGDGKAYWDCKNDNGDPVPPGLYLILIKNEKEKPKVLKQVILR